MLPASAEPLIFQGLCYDKDGTATQGRGRVARRGSRGPRCLGATLPSGPAGDRTTVIPRPPSITSARRLPKSRPMPHGKASCILNLANWLLTGSKSGGPPRSRDTWSCSPGCSFAARGHAAGDASLNK